MKKICIAFICMVCITKTYADEGMWLPLLLGQQVYNKMVKEGLKLTADQIYSINHASLKDAILNFNGCTAEIVSSQGLVFTNHHCGYDAITAASTVEHNYLRDGFWAYTKEQEIPAVGIAVRMLDYMKDVTDVFNKELIGLSGIARMNKIEEIEHRIEKEITHNNPFVYASVASMFNDNQFYLFVYKVYKDIRLVGAGPEMLGKFGGDTDNWEWPRHTCDFSIFRIYADAEGNPTNYSPNNIPYHAKTFLTISLKEKNPNDFAMVIGYPGVTNRYETSYGIKLSIGINNPSLVKLRGIRLKYMLAEMQSSPAIKLQLAPSYARIANYWKYFDGETKEVIKNHVIENKLVEEQQFIDWAKDKHQYNNLFNQFDSLYAQWRPYAASRVYLIEGILGSPLVAFCTHLHSYTEALQSGDAHAISQAMQSLDSLHKDFIAHENIKSDQEILSSMLLQFYLDIPVSQQPTDFYNTLLRNYTTIDQSPFTAYSNEVFANSMFVNQNLWNLFIQNPSYQLIKNDPAYKILEAFMSNYNTKILPHYIRFVQNRRELGHLYLKGLFEMDPEKMNMTYPDANSTLRLTYGVVKGYEPRDAAYYYYECVGKGALEKYIPGDYEFDLPQRWLDLYKARDFGNYIDKKKNDLVLTFITTTDITGGNSGSPVLDAKGNLIGLAFDGNYESLSDKLAFDKDLNRTICVDIRYVLWAIDIYGGAKNIIKELKIVQ